MITGSQKLIVAAIVTNYRPRVDGSFNITLNTNVLSKEQKAVVDELFQKPCYVLIKEGEITPDESQILDSVQIDLQQKPPSQRLRGVLYRCWEQNDGGHLDFADYYKFQMEKLIIHFKNKLQ